MKPLAALHRLKRRVRVLTAQKRRLVWELKAAKSAHLQPSPLPRPSAEQAS